MAKLGECFSVIRNGASIRQTDGAGGFPITRIETIADKTINREKFGYAEIYDLAQYRDYILQDGDILMSHINSEKHLGKVALYSKQDDEQIIHGMNLLMLRADTQKVIPEYAKYYFESQKFLRQIGRITKKSVNQASFTVTALKELEIPLANIIVQRDISEKLKKVDWLVSLRKQQLVKLDELVKARFVEMFGDLVVGNKIQTSKKKIGEIASVTKLAGFEFTKYIQYKEHGDIIMLRGLNCKQGKLILDDVKWIDRETSDLLPRSKLYYGDILMTYAGTIGDVAMVDKNDKYHLAPNVAKVSINNKKAYNPIFLMYLFLYSNDYIMRFASQVAQASINMEKIRNFEYYFPDVTFQNQFATFVERVDQQKQTVQQSLEKLELMKKALMQEYFG